MKDHAIQLIDKLERREARIGIIGLGYVGLPLAIRFTEVGYPVVGFDIDPAKPERIARGETYIKHIPCAAIRQAVASGLEATTDFSGLGDVDAVIICVPTPLDDHREPDLSFVVNTLESALPYLHAGRVVTGEHDLAGDDRGGVASASRRRRSRSR